MRLYGSVGATTPQEKINALKLSLEGEANFYAFAGEATPEMLVGCLEYEFLSRSGLIELLQA